MISKLTSALLTLLSGLLITGHTGAQPPGKYPSAVVKALTKAGRNRGQLQKALDHYYAAGDRQKIEAIDFLITYMPYHYSVNYYWADVKGKHVPFDELSYPNFEASIAAFNRLKLQYEGLHPVQWMYSDADTLSAAYLIDNIDRAFAGWKQAYFPKFGFRDFCEYLLPYRTSMEPVQDWRKVYEEKFKSVSGNIPTQGIRSAIGSIPSSTSWFAVTWLQEHRNDPLPRLGALQLLLRKKGPCEDIAALHTFILRSQGIPATVDIIPYWATTAGSHFLTVVPDVDSVAWVLNSEINTFTPCRKALQREPGKVLRTTFSRQGNTLAAGINPEKIPPGSLRADNYIDVTREYWPVEDVEVSLSASASAANTAIVYACVFNNGRWRPIWWGKKQNNQVRFIAMSKGVVYLPMYYTGKELTPAGYPMAVGYQHSALLRPDKSKLRAIGLQEQDKYLKFRPGKKYTLYYWDNGWVALNTLTASQGAKELVFDRAPQNVLFLLRPEYSENKERPFIITDKGERAWF